MAFYYDFAAAFVALAVTLIVSAAVRRNWRGALYAVVFAGPAAVAWIAYSLYESNLDLGVAPIRIDLPFLWAGLLAVSLPAVLYALVRLVEVVTSVVRYTMHVGNRKAIDTEPLRSWQDLDHPRD